MLKEIAGGTLPLWQQVQARALSEMPGIVAALVILAVGALLGWLARRVAQRLLRAGKTEWPVEAFGLGAALGPWNRPVVVGRSAQWFVIFCSTIVALYALDPRLASTLAERVLLYVPKLASGVLILVGGILLSRFAGRGVLIAAVNHDLGGARLLAAVTRTALVVLSVAIALEHAGIGQRTVLVAFAIVFGGLTLAASIALGLALQDPLRRWLTEQDGTRRRRERDEESMHHV